MTIILTQGDPAGIGPEVILAGLDRWRPPSDARLIVLGYPDHFRPIGSATAPGPFRTLSAWAAGPSNPGIIWAQPDEPAYGRPVRPGQLSELAAGAARQCLEEALGWLLSGRADGLCTGPIHKAAMARVGFPYPGHTEFLAARSGARPVAMLLVGGGLRVALATVHEPIARVPQLINTADLVELLRLLACSLPDFGLEAPRIAVAGLNPHAGEEGRFGREELEVIAPAVEVARARGVDARGPYSADTVFARARAGEFDAVLAMYHDQGLIAVKTLDFHGAVNVTLGLPFVRTSPDHGTALDLAGRGLARPDSMIAALQLAFGLAAERRRRSASVPAR